MDNSDVATLADHNQTISEPPVWPYSGRGERRPQTARAARTNDPLGLPDGLHGQSPAARRWRDLATHYSVQLGVECMKREDIRARVRSVLWLTCEVERLQDERLCGKPVATETVLHLTQELRLLLRELGLSGSTSTTLPSVADYVGVSDDEAGAA
jgi:hypothetical protein